MSIKTTTVALPAEVANLIIQNTIDESAVMKLAGNTIRIKNRGEAIPVIAGDPTAYIVEEGGVKTASDGTPKTVTMIPKTFAIIETFSNQFREDNEALYAEMVKRLPRIIAQKFDEEVFSGTTSANFHTLAGVPAVSLSQSGSTPWKQIVSARAAVEAADGELTAWALANQGITSLMGEVDGNDRPLFVGGIGDGEFARIAGAPVEKAYKAYKNVTSGNDVLGFGGDWDNTVVGVAGDITISITDQATITGVGNLFEKNMFAVRVEGAFGFVAGYTDDSNVPTQFAKLTA